MRLLPAGFLIVATIVSPGASALTLAQGSARAAIEANNARFAAAAAKADAAAIAKLYTEKGAAYPPNGDAVQGRAALEAMWKSVFDSGLTNVTLTTKEVEAHGDVAHEVGAYELKAKDGTVADRGKYIVIWKREGGEWKLHRDIWNTSMPAK